MTTEHAEAQRHRGDAKPDLGSELTEQVIGAAIEVHRAFGAGFLGQTYHRALEIELKHRGLEFRSEVPVELTYRGDPVGQGRVDLLVEGRLVVELKAAAGNPTTYQRQVVSYLKATGLPLGLVINFEVKRLIDGVCRVAL